MSEIPSIEAENSKKTPKRGHGRKDTPDRLPPYSVEAERGVLGCILLEPEECLNACQEHGVLEDWFYDLPNALIYHNLLALETSRAGGAEIGIDIITLQQRLRDTGNLDEVGGLAYLSELSGFVPSAANLAYYLDIVREKWLARRVIQAGTEMVSCIFEAERPVDSILGDCQRDITGLVDTSVPRAELRVREFLPGVIRKLEEYHRGHAQMDGLSTGLEYVDKMLCGIGGENGNMFVLAARPGVGKTSMATQIALHVALDHLWFDAERDANGDMVMENDKPKGKGGKGLPVGIFSLEMASEALVKRMVFQRAQADMQRWRTGFAYKDDFPPIIRAVSEIQNAQIFVDDTPRTSVEELVAKARRMRRQHGIRLFVVDYLQLLHARKDYKNDRVQELAYVTGMLFALGKLLNVPIIILTQMNRDYEKDPLRDPRLSDLKDCGATEQDADVVAFLHGTRMSDTAKERFDEQMAKAYPNTNGTGIDWSKAPMRVNMLFAKNRYGPTGKAELLFHKSSTLFVDYEKWQKSQRATQEPQQPKL